MLIDYRLKREYIQKTRAYFYTNHLEANLIISLNQVFRFVKHLLHVDS